MGRPKFSIPDGSSADQYYPSLYKKKEIAKTGPKTLDPPPDLMRFITSSGMKPNETTFAAFLDAFYRNKGSVLKACKELGLFYGTVKQWKKEIPGFKESLEMVQELINDEIEQRFLDRVLDPNEKYPAYMIFWLKSRHPDYQEKTVTQAPTINILIEDSTFKKGVKVIESNVVQPNDQPKQLMAAETNTS